jgi:hypothetical protein
VRASAHGAGENGEAPQRARGSAWLQPTRAEEARRTEEPPAAGEPCHEGVTPPGRRRHLRRVRTFAELEARYQEQPPPPRAAGLLELIVVRRGEGRHDTPETAELDLDSGLVGDRWAHDRRRDPAAQLTLMDARVARLLAGAELPLHTPGDNLLVDLDLGVAALPVGSRVRVGSAVVEVTALPHAGCRKFSARFGQDALRWVNWHAHRERRLRGVNARVVQAGTIAVGDRVEVVPASI